MPEFVRKVRKVKELASPMARTGAALAKKGAEKGAFFVKEKAAPKAFELLKNKVAPKTKELGVKTWALMRNRVAPKLAEVSREKILPGAKMAGKTLAVYTGRAGKAGATMMIEKGLPAMRNIAGRAKQGAYTAYEKTREMTIQRKYGNTASGRAAAVAARIGIKEIYTLRVAHALVQAGYRPETAARMLEELQEQAMSHPTAGNRKIAKDLAGLAIIATHDAIRHGGAHPEDAYYGAMRMINSAKTPEQVEALAKLFKERLRSPARINTILQIMKPHLEKQAKVRQFLAEAEPPW